MSSKFELTVLGLKTLPSISNGSSLAGLVCFDLNDFDPVLHRLQDLSRFYGMVRGYWV